MDITSTAGATAADFIGFVLDDGTSYWTTISTVTDSEHGNDSRIRSYLSGNRRELRLLLHHKIDPSEVLRAFVRDSSGIDTDTGHRPERLRGTIQQTSKDE